MTDTLNMDDSVWLLCIRSRRGGSGVVGGGVQAQSCSQVCFSLSVRVESDAQLVEQIMKCVTVSCASQLFAPLMTVALDFSKI